MEKNSIKFSDNGSEFNFVFVDGSKSPSFNSKIAGFEALDGLFKKGKITEDEVPVMRDQIFCAENLPFDDSTQKVTVVIGENFLDFLLRLLEDITSSDEPVEVATFKKCECGENHGKIYCRDCYTGLLECKSEALLALDVLKKDGHVNDEEFAKVKAEIEKELSE